MAGTDEVLEKAADWLTAGKQVALATVIRTWGSSPMPVGSQLCVDGDGAFVGSVSGGCIEGAVVGEAVKTIADGEARTLDFGVTDEQAWEVGLACGGDIRIHVTRADEPDNIRRMLEERPVAQVTDLASGGTAFVDPSATGGELALDDDLIEAARLALRDDKSRTVESETGDAFIHAFNPPLKLLIVGAVHIAQALVPLARVVGYEITVIDPRQSFASEARFPGVGLSTEWPDEAVDRLGFDARTAIVLLTHDPKLDDPALERALKSEAFYIGALGSRKTHAARLDRLTEAGFADEDFRRINGPIGLDLGASSPSEIAVSILAEMVAAKHGKSFR